LNDISFALVDTAPGADGRGRVQIFGSTRDCYFHVARFTAPWPTIAAGDRVLVQVEGGNLVADWRLGA
jgi:hypothetical protein